MSVLAELFVSSYRDAKKFEERLEDTASQMYQREDARGLTFVAFEELWHLMTQKAFDENELVLRDLKYWSHAKTLLDLIRQKLAVIEMIFRSVVLQQEIGESLLHQFPSNYLKALAELDDVKLSEIAEKWSQTVELSLWEGHAAVSMLQLVRSLAREARLTKKGLYLWGSV